jgi:hypothetical protein
MNLILEEEIRHNVFGTGKVISQEADRITVQFAEPHGIKKFLYPDAFERNLQLSDPAAGKLVLEELYAKKAQVEAEKLRKQQEYAAINNEALEKSLLLKKKKAAPKSKRNAIAIATETGTPS